MSLSTRIAIGPSRRLANVRAAMMAGAIVVTVATVAARLVAAQAAPAALWLVTGAAVLAAGGACARRWIKPVGSRVYEVFIGDRAVVSVRCPGEDTMPQAFELTDASMVWPGFAVLSLSPSPPLPSAPASRLPVWLRPRTLDLAVVRADMDAHDGWALHRFLLWAQRNGSHRSGSHAGDSIPKDSLV